MLANYRVVVAMLAQRRMQVRVLIPDQPPGIIVVVLQDVIVSVQLVRKLLFEVMVVCNRL